MSKVGEFVEPLRILMGVCKVLMISSMFRNVSVAERDA